jgi:predicted N-acetyltransferase YhbS
MVIESISRDHNRLAFTCGNEKLDRYLHETAHQAKRKGLAATFVAVDEEEPATILGYYSLSSFIIRGLDIPDLLRRKLHLPQHEVGATLLGRLAVAKDSQGQGVGELLVADALKRAYIVSDDIGSVGVVVDAIDEKGLPYYRKFGFEVMNDDDLRMVIMMDTIGNLLPGVSRSAGQTAAS